MIFHDGFYYYCESRNDQRSIAIRRSRSIGEISADDGVFVWHAPNSGPCSHAIWAPELHFINGRWLIYFAADDGRNESHRIWVLECRGEDPRGDYKLIGQVNTGSWAIDGTILKLSGERMFFIWSGWPADKDGQQNLYIAPMHDPLTLAGERTLLCSPDQPWERHAMPICEGPQILKRNSDLFVVYSASGSWTENYCLGLLHNSSDDVLNPKAWTKYGPVLQKTDEVWGVGHCSFVKSVCQTEDWILFHSKSSKKHGWNDRDVHAQRFTWTSEGLPDFGKPRARGTPLIPQPETTSSERVSSKAL